MILMGHRSSKKGNDPIAGELVDGAFVFVDLVHEDTKAAVHDFVNLLRVQTLKDSSGFRLRDASG